MIPALTIYTLHMTYHQHYCTPKGFDDLVMSSDGEVLTRLWFKGSRDGGEGSDGAESDLPVFRETCRWLDIYFSGRDPGFMPPYRLLGATPFREAVSREMLKIPFGATVTYGDIATEIAKRRGVSKMSAQAVGQAVGWNPICLIIPCHRVIGAGGAITGYGGGLENKVSLLAHEGADFFDMRVAAPKGAKSEPDEKLVCLCVQIVGRASAPLGYGRPKCCRDGGTTTICLVALVQSGMDAPYIFGDLDDEDAKFLLQSFIDFRSLYHFDLAMQLSRLLAERGMLVRACMGRIIAKTDWSSYGNDGLLLAYLGSVKGADEQICRLLDVVPEDGRDGLFFACWKSQSVSVQKKLLEKFKGWTEGDPDFGSGTGEAAWLGAFLAKWMREETFPYDRLESLVRWHLARQSPKLLDADSNPTSTSPSGSRMEE